MWQKRTTHSDFEEFKEGERRGMTIYGFFLDFAMASILILVGQFLRAKVKFFQQFFIPASMIAGFLGLFLGEYFLDVSLPWSGSESTYAGCLIIVVFAIIGLNGFDMGTGKGVGKDTVERIISVTMYRFVAFFIQIAMGVFLTMTVVKALFPGINEGFAILMTAGFNGGHGTAAAVGTTFAELGWEEATDLGMTFATVGILTGVFGGLAFIKWGTKKGVTGYIKDFKYIDGDMKTGLISKENLQPMGNDTISSVSMDTLCYHMSLVLALAGGGYALNKYAISGILSGVPDFTIVYLVALAFFMCFRKTGIYAHMDTRINTRIAGAATDYLVFFGIASIKVPIIIEYWQPLLICILGGFFCVFISVIPLGYKMIKKSWFEHSIFCFGYLTGVFAISFLLLRIVDPENKSKTLESIAMTPWPGLSDIFIWSLFPQMLMFGQGWTVFAIMAAGIIMALTISIVCKCWYKEPMTERGWYNVDET